MTRAKVFISYSHKDEEWKNRLVMQLKVLELQGKIEEWNDQKIIPGEDWHKAINIAMQESRVAILMISTDFLVSEFIHNSEIPTLLNRHKQDGMIIVPVLVYSCLWKAVPWLSPMEILPRDGFPLARGNKAAWESRLTKITEEIYQLLSDNTETITV